MNPSTDFRPGNIHPEHEREGEDSQLLIQAKKRVDIKLGFLTHLFVFACVNAGFFVLGWLVYPVWGWALGLAIHGVATVASLQGQGLRRRMLSYEIKQLRRQS